MKKNMTSILITVVMSFAILIAGVYIYKPLFEDGCGNEIIQKLPSPNGESVAYIFTRDCGATTSPSPQLSILKKDKKLANEGGNTYRSDKDFTIKWLSNRRLQVVYEKNSETYEKDRSVNGIKITYVIK